MISKSSFFHLAILFFSLTSLLAANETEDKTFQKAEISFFEMKFKDAETLLKSVLKKKPNHPKAASLLGDIYLFQKAYRKAIRQYKRSVKISSGSSSGSSIEYFRMGQAFLELKQFKKARLYFQKAYESNTKVKTALFQIGYIALFYERDKKQTIRYWERFTQEAPNDQQYDKVKKAIELLKNPNFKLPPPGSDISLQEALLFGANAFKTQLSKTEDEKAGNARSKINNKTKELLEDEEL